MHLQKIAILGASGYSGGELLRLLGGRDDVLVHRAIARSSAGEPVSRLHPHLAGQCDLLLEPLDLDLLGDVDLAFLALPSGEGMHLVPELRRRVGKVIDLGGDFRLQDTRLYEQFYEKPHSAPDVLKEAVYGLPEVNADGVRRANLVANPGCYPTSAILGLWPALAHDLIEDSGIVITAISGVSGAGRSASAELSFCEVNENIRAYRIGQHQHIPEIESVLSEVTGRPVSLSFVPHLAPLQRGIYTTIHARLRRPCGEKEARELYVEAYRHAPFVRITERIPQLRAVIGTNYCDLGVYPDPRTNQLIVVSALDNLIKGAAGQAIQNMNLMFGFPEETGLCL